ncbi:recombinase family protein [Kitasatospora sp. NPDC001683]
MATHDALIPVQRGRVDQEPAAAIGYIRVSLAREEMISPELQRKSIEEWSARTGHKIVDWVEDLDKTGRNFKRRIMRVIERVEAGEATIIAVWKYSRFGRSRTGCATNLDRVERAGGSLVSATEYVDTATAEGKLQRGIIFEFNAYESDRAGTQWRETHAHRRESGLPATGGHRLGYIWYPRKIFRPDGSVTLQEERYEIDPAVAPLVGDLYQRYINGEGFLPLCQTLNEAGHRTVQGNPWSISALKRYMDGGFPAGYLRIHDPDCRQPYKADCPAHKLVRHPTLHHPAIISDENWALYQQRRKQVSQAPPRARRASYPLSGLVRCGICGGTTTRGKSKNAYHNYRCKTRHSQGRAVCEGWNLSERKLLAAVKTWLEGIVEEVEASARQADSRARELRLRQPSTGPSRTAALEERIAKLDKAIARQMQTFAMLEEDDDDGTLAEGHRQTLLALRNEKAQARADLDDAKPGDRHEDPDVRRDAAIAVALGLLEEWGTLAPDRMNALLRRVVEQVSVTKDRRVVITPNW